MKPLLFVCCLFPLSVMAQYQPVGIFESYEDVGNPKLSGTTQYNPGDQSYTIKGGGANMWAAADQFHFLWKKIQGDFMVRATIRFVGGGTSEHRKMGIMAREQLTGQSPYADAAVHGNTLTAIQSRSTAGGDTEQLVLSSYNPTEIELERVGNTFRFSAAPFGENYKSITKEITLANELFVGLFVCSHAEDILETAVFTNVQIIIPPDRDYRPYRDYIGSHIEIMEVATGKRKIIHSAPNSLQAPNWTPDNRYLIYNSEGLLYKYNLQDGSISKLNTGPATSNNNDHVLSFDGKMIGISHHVGEKRTSTIFTLPITGSDHPTQMTDEKAGHSYLHGWSPDGKKLIFTGQRNGNYDIYTVDVATKRETRLTEHVALDDGPEYTPDGKSIWFNSVRTGTMKLWKMKPDGSDQQQVTFDEYNDWFPHFSPDGKWVLFEAFPKEIDPTTHPFYKKVYLRIMPTSGGVPKTIAYIFGGQGTINVPSWSPDGKYIAFVSNSKL